MGSLRRKFDKAFKQEAVRVLMIALIVPPKIALMDPLFIFHSFTKNPCILLLNILSLSSCFPPFHCLPCKDLFPGEGRRSLTESGNKGDFVLLSGICFR